MSVEENMRLMQTLDDAWNSQDWETFKNGISRILLFIGRANRSRPGACTITKPNPSSHEPTIPKEMT